MNNISEETTKKKQIVSGLHLLRDYLSHSNKDSLNLSSQTLSRLKSFSTRLSNSGKENNSSNSQDDKNKRIKDLEYAAKNDKELGSVDSLRDTFVFSDGSVESELMFVGEAPGYEEEKLKKPFVGPSGQLLDKIILAMGLSRNDIYISNIVKYRPKIGDGRQGHSNRKPTSDEMNLSIKYILDEIEIIKPKLIVTLGGTATKGLLGLDEPISSLRGKVHDINHCKAIVTYHPSYLLRSKNPNKDKRLVWEDMLMAMDFLKMTISPKQKNYFK